jgi:hypothetical protein
MGATGAGPDCLSDGAFDLGPFLRKSLQGLTQRLSLGCDESSYLNFGTDRQPLGHDPSFPWCFNRKQGLKTESAG